MYRHVFKRAIDCAAAAVGLLLLTPVMLLVAVAIKLFSPGPVFYRGERVGLNGRIFRVYKFRSMVVNAEACGGSATADDDPRLTRIGLWLRLYKVDELPQLLNVLFGHMSLVGPRPEVLKYVEMYSAEERSILTVKPGITDWASLWNFNEGRVLAGSTDPETVYERVIRPTKLRLQLLYVSTQSLAVDLEILGHTILKLILRDRWMPAVVARYTQSRSTSVADSYWPHLFQPLERAREQERPAAVLSGANDTQNRAVGK